MSVRFLPAFRYDCKSMMKGAGVFLLVMGLNIVFFTAVMGTADGNGRISITGFGTSGSGGIFMLVMGIVCIRENMRLLSQHGVTRQTAFLAELAALTVTSAAVALAGVALSWLAQAAVGSQLFFAGDLYQLLYLKEWSENAMTAAQHGASFLFDLAWMIPLALAGQFFSLLFWRLNKFWTVVAAVGIPALLYAAPLLLMWLGLGDAMSRTVRGVLQFLGDSLWNFLGVSVLCAAVLAAVNWLLIRRLNIRAGK